MSKKSAIEVNKLKLGSSDTSGIYVGSSESKYAISVDSSGNQSVAYDKVTYNFSVGNKSDEIGPEGGTFSVPSVTSNKVHGNGVSESISYSPSTITVSPNTDTSAGKSGAPTITQSGSGLTGTCSWNQGKDYITSYGDLDLSSVSISCDDIPASGGDSDSRRAISGNIYQTYYYKSGNSVKNSFAASSYVSWNKVSADSKGTTASNRTSAGTLTASFSVNSKSGSKSVSVYQQANTASYEDLTGTLSLSVGDIAASGGSKSTSDVTATKSCSQVVSYTSGSTRAGTITYGSITGDNVSADSKGTTVSSRNAVKSNAFSITATGEGSKTKTAYCTVYQAANAITTYGALGGTLSLAIDDIAASGGTKTASDITATRNCTQTITYTSGSTRDGSITYGSITGDDVSASSKGTTASDRNTVKSNAFSLTATGEGSKTKTAYCTVYQAANAITTYGSIGGTLSLSLDSDIPASGGSKTTSNVTATKSCSQTITYTSGSTRAGSITYSSITGDTVSADSLGTTAKSRTAIKSSAFSITATGEGSKTKTATCTVYQAANAITSYSDLGGTLSLSVGNIAASGGSKTTSNVTATKSCTQTVTYTSGSTRSGSITYGSITGDKVSADSKGTIASGVTTVKSNAFSITATGENSKTKTAYCTVYQDKNAITKYGDVEGTLKLSVGDIAASGGSKTTSDVTATKNCTQTITYTSGSTREGIITYGSITGDTVSADSLGTTVKDRTEIKSLAFSITASGEGNLALTTYCSVYQAKNAILSYSYDAPYGITISCSDIAASGGTISSGSVSGTVSQTRYYNYDAGSALKSDTVTGADSTSWSGGASGDNLGETSTDRTSKGTLYYKYTKNGKSTTASCTVYQAANSLNSYSSLDISGVSLSCSDVPASGGSVTSGSTSGNIYQNYNWSSGSYSHTFAASSYVSYSGGASSIASLGETEKDRTSTGKTLTATYTINGKSATKSVTVYQAANSLSSYGSLNLDSVSVSCSTVPASGGSVTSGSSSGTIYQNYTWTSGTYSHSFTASSYLTGWSGGASDVASLGTTVKDRTSVGTLYVNFEINGVTGSKGVTVYQAANVKTLSSIYLSPYTPDSTWIVTVSSGNWNTVPASGGYIKSEGYYHYTYTSGSTSDSCQTTDVSLTFSSGYDDWITAHDNGGYYIHSRGTTTGSARTVTVTWTSSGKTATKSLTQAANTLTWNTPSISGLSSSVALAVTGQTYTISPTMSNSGTYTSGSTASETPTASYSVVTSKTGYSLSSNKVTVTNNKSTSARNGYVVRVTATGPSSSKTNTYDITFNQVAGYYSYSAITGSLSYSNASPAAGTVSPTISYSQTYGWNENTTELGSYSCSLGSYSMTSGNGASITASSGVITWTANTSTSSKRTSNTVSVTVSGGGSKTKQLTATATQNKDYLSYWDAPTGLELTVGTIPASGGSISSGTLSCTAGSGVCYQIAYYASGNRVTNTPSYSGSYSTAVSAFSLDTTVTSGPTKIGTLTYTYSTSNGGGSATASCDVYQAQNVFVEYEYDAPYGLTATCSDVPASGGSVTSGVISGTCSQKRYYCYSAGHRLTSDTITASYTGSWSGGASSIDSLGTTVKDRSVVGSNLVYTYTANGKSSTASCAVYQAANAKTSTTYSPNSYYANVSISWSTALSVTAGTGTVSASAGHYAYDYYTSGSYNNNHQITGDGVAISFSSSNTTTKTTGRFTLSSNASGATLTHSNMTTNAATDSATVYAYNTSYSTSSSKNSASTGSVKNEKTSTTYSPNSYGASASISWSTALSASGGSGTVTGSAWHYAYDQYTTGSYNNNHQITGDGFAISFSSSNTTTKTTGRFTLSSNASGATLTHSSMTTNTGTDSATIYVYNTSSSSSSSVNTCGTGSATNAVTNSDYNSSNGSYTVTKGTITNSLTAAGGSATWTAGSASHTHTYYYYYTSGSTSGPYYSYPSDSVTVSASGTRMTVSGSKATHSSMTTNVTTDTLTVTWTNASSTSVTSSATASVSNAVTNSDYNSSNSAYTVTAGTITNNLTAAGGSATWTGGSASHTHTYYYYYTSGSTSGPYTSTKSDSVSISASGARMTVSGSTATHSSMTTNVTTDTLTVTWTNASDTSKTTSKTASVSNSASYGALGGTLSLSVGDIAASGGSKSTSNVTATKSCTQTVSYTSGSTRDGTITYGSITGDTVSASSLGTTVKDRTAIKSNAFSITASGEGGQTKTAYCTVYQAANALLSYSYDAPYGISISCSDIPASGGTISSGTVSGTCYQTRYYNYSAGSALKSDTVSGADSASWSGGATGSDLGTTATARTSKGTLYYTYTKNSKSTTASCTVYQAQNKLESTSTSNWTVTVNSSSISIPATSGSQSVGCASAYHTETYTYTSGATSSATVNDNFVCSTSDDWITITN